MGTEAIPKIEMNIIALADSQSQKDNFVVILEDIEGLKRLPIIIGLHEAQAIAVTLEKINPVRPITHDLFAQTLQALHCTLSEVFIYKYEQEIFYAQLSLKCESNQIKKVEARPSDALALAVRFQCAIYVAKEVLQQNGLDIDQSKSFAAKRGTLEEYTKEELEKMLENLIAKEDYESARRVRDALNKKKGNENL